MASVPNDPDYHKPEPKAISVAIIGGGIGGVSLALGLLKYSHIDVHVYEAAPAFGEIGAGVSLGPNAQRALEIIGPSAKEAMLKTATANMWDSHANEYLQYRVVCIKSMDRGSYSLIIVFVVTRGKGHRKAH